jgi:hypothetical protein
MCGCSDTGRFSIDLGLSAAGRISDVHDGCALSIVATPREFEPEMPLPPNVRFVGPILDALPLMNRSDEITVGSGAEPLVIVSFSTSHRRRDHRAGASC